MPVEINDRTADVLTTVKNLTAARFKEFTQTVVEIAKEEAPFITGNLRRSINHDQPGSELKRRVFTQTNYGGYVHEGVDSRKQPGNPFITRAIDRALPEFNDSGPWA